jgi:hypothetical protein
LTSSQQPQPKAIPLAGDSEASSEGFLPTPRRPLQTLNHVRSDIRTPAERPVFSTAPPNPTPPSLNPGQCPVPCATLPSMPGQTQNLLGQPTWTNTVRLSPRTPLPAAQSGVDKPPNSANRSMLGVSPSRGMGVASETGSQMSVTGDAMTPVSAGGHLSSITPSTQDARLHATVSHLRAALRQSELACHASAAQVRIPYSYKEGGGRERDTHPEREGEGGSAAVPAL